LQKTKRLELSNRKAYHEYFFETKYIAGLVLAGTEIKSLRAERRVSMTVIVILIKENYM
jgi:tmRNA-binding protein